MEHEMREAADPDGKKVMHIGNSRAGYSRSGLSVHLLLQDDSEAMCGQSGPFHTGPAGVSFEMAGCTRCAKAARQCGYTHVVDEMANSLVKLEAFRPWTAG